MKQRNKNPFQVDLDKKVKTIMLLGNNIGEYLHVQDSKESMKEDENCINHKIKD